MGRSTSWPYDFANSAALQSLPGEVPGLASNQLAVSVVTSQLVDSSQPNPPDIGSSLPA